MASPQKIIDVVYVLVAVAVVVYLANVFSGGMVAEESCRNMCGDGVCQEVVCEAVGCPCAETLPTCPADCGTRTIGFGETETISSEDLRITFRALLSDSRCPTGVVCVRAGDVEVLIAAEKEGTPFQQRLKYPAFDGENTTTFHGYQLTLIGVEPYPKAGEELPEKDYRIKLRITPII